MPAANTCAAKARASGRHAPSRRCARPAPRSLAGARAAVARETDPSQRIVITGMGVASVFGNDPDAFYEALLAGRSGISTIERFDASEYPTRFAGQIKNFE